jgi:hypothetical protein
MRRAVFCSAMLAVAAVGAGAGPTPRVAAQDSKAAAASIAPETEDEIKERKIRRVCESALCATLHMQRPATGELACSVQKTWRKEVLTKILSRAKVPWPWGYARCAGDVKLDRATLIKAMTEPDFEAQFQKHDLRCELEGEKEKYEVKLQISPKVTFKQGKAVKASLNWGKIEGPKIAQTALWPVTAADNSFGLLQSIVVDDINEFIQTRCMETNGEWQAK